MLDFKAKNSISAVELRPRPRWGAFYSVPRPPSWIKGGLLLKEKEGREGEGIRMWREGKGRGGRERKGEGERNKNPPSDRSAYGPAYIHTNDISDHIKALNMKQMKILVNICHCQS